MPIQTLILTEHVLLGEAIHAGLREFVQLNVTTSLNQSELTYRPESLKQPDVVVVEARLPVEAASDNTFSQGDT